MTFPDCRTDEYYNEKRLNKEDSDIIKGYDTAYTWCESDEVN